MYESAINATLLFEKLEEKIYESTEDIDSILERLKEQTK